MKFMQQSDWSRRPLTGQQLKWTSPSCLKWIKYAFLFIADRFPKWVALKIEQCWVWWGKNSKLCFDLVTCYPMQTDPWVFNTLRQIDLASLSNLALALYSNWSQPMQFCFYRGIFIIPNLLARWRADNNGIASVKSSGVCIQQASHLGFSIQIIQNRRERASCP